MIRTAFVTYQGDEGENVGIRFVALFQQLILKFSVCLNRKINPNKLTQKMVSHVKIGKAQKLILLR